MDKDLKKKLDEVVDCFGKEQATKLIKLYSSDVDVFRKKERETLMTISICLKTALMDAVMPVLEGRVPYVNTLWLESMENMTDVSFIYVVWENEEIQKEFAGGKNVIIKKVSESITDKISPLNKRKKNKEGELIKRKIYKAKIENVASLFRWCSEAKDNLIKNIEKGESVDE